MHARVCVGGDERSIVVDRYIMAGFSASSVKLGDLGSGDFLSPGQACVNPLFGDSASSSAAVEGGEKKVALKIGYEGGGGAAASRNPFILPAEPDLIKTTERKTATVTLADCLACSGCVTSAETVLLEQQSVGNFMSAAAAKGKDHDVVFVTVSRQSLASLAVHFGMPAADFVPLFSAFLEKKCSVDHILDESHGVDMALAQLRAEFLHRKRHACAAPKWKRPDSTQAVSSTQIKNGAGDAVAFLRPPAPGGVLPMLTSACPGWVCYAEKTKPETLPYISVTKSPQQIMGGVVKRMLSKRMGIDPQRVYHCTIMPCADKKLEASRRDFYEQKGEHGYPDVDCVLTTIEVAQMLEAESDLSAFAPASADSESMDCDDPCEAFALRPNELKNKPAEHAMLLGSGGYLDHLFRFAARELHGVQVDGPLEYKRGRNADFKTVELRVDGNIVLRFAASYGFRNIQTIARQLKRGKCAYDFVEIMACPSGCTNGGGQIREKETAGALEASRLRLQKVKLEFHSIASGTGNPDLSKPCTDISNWSPVRTFEDESETRAETSRGKEYTTTYHAVPELDATTMHVNW